MITRDKEMSENLRETKSLLAKLMATENIRVEHKNIPTGAFDLKNRVLYLPMFKYMTGDIYDLLVSHEVSHALHTPEEGWHDSISAKGKGYKSFLNVVEDARIEKKIKRRFPGCRAAMTRGYIALLNEDFFGIKGRDLSELGLIDRINLYSKGGVGLGIEFNDEERKFVKRVENVETWEDVVDVTNDLFDYAKENEVETEFDSHDFGAPSEMSEDEWNEDYDPSDYEDSESMESPSEESEESESSSSSTDGAGEEDSEKSESDEDTKKEDCDAPVDSCENGEDGKEKDGSGKSDSEGENEKTEEEKAKPSASSGEEGGTSGSFSPDKFDGNEDYDPLEPVSETDKAWRDKEAELTDDTNNVEYHYTKFPKIDLGEVILDYKNVHEEISDFYNTETENNWEVWKRDYLSDGRKWFSEFRKNNNKVVSYLAKEFEMKKAADQHKRATTAKTGVLDMTKIHAVSFSENIFSRISVLPDGKNHGLVMFIDWSGSMSNSMKGTIEQLMTLILFCRKVQIPFEVYAFADNYYRKKSGGYEDFTPADYLSSEKGDLGMNKSFRLLNLMSSRMSAKEYVDGCVNMTLLMYAFSSYNYYNRNEEKYCPVPIGYSLGGTPLNEAIITAHKLIPEFAKANNVQLVNAVFLTDGSSSQSGQVFDEDGGMRRVGAYGTDVKLILTDPKTRNQYDLSRGGRETTVQLLRSLRGSLGINVVGFYILSGGRRLKSYALSEFFSYEELDMKVKELRKNKFVVSKMRGYNEEYLIKGGADLEIDTDSFLDKVNTGAKKGELLRAFKKDRKGKLQNRVMLSRFVDLIAA